MRHVTRDIVAIPCGVATIGMLDKCVEFANCKHPIGQMPLLP